MTKQELIERLAEIEHQRWSDWQRYVHEQTLPLNPADPCRPRDAWISARDIEHWERLIATEYANLPEYSKQSDRDQVARYLPLIVEFVESWIASQEKENMAFKHLADRWVGDMLPDPLPEPIEQEP